MESIKNNIAKRFDCVYMYSREINNINDIFERFIITLMYTLLLKNVIKQILWSFTIN